jgi:hypothetical protein
MMWQGFEGLELRKPEERITGKIFAKGTQLTHICIEQVAGVNVSQVTDWFE